MDPTSSEADRPKSLEIDRKQGRAYREGARPQRRHVAHDGACRTDAEVVPSAYADRRAAGMYMVRGRHR